MLSQQQNSKTGRDFGEPRTNRNPNMLVCGMFCAAEATRTQVFMFTVPIKVFTTGLPWLKECILTMLSLICIEHLKKDKIFRVYCVPISQMNIINFCVGRESVNIWDNECKISIDLLILIWPFVRWTGQKDRITLNKGSRSGLEYGQALNRFSTHILIDLYLCDVLFLSLFSSSLYLYI